MLTNGIMQVNRIKKIWRGVAHKLFSVIRVKSSFSLTVKAATLIFISGRGSAFLSAKLGKSGLFWPRKRACIS